MSEDKEEIEISYEYTSEDYKIINLPIISIGSLILCGLIPIGLLIIIETIMVLIFYSNGFSEFEIVVTSLSPAIYFFTIITYIPIKLILDKINWKSIKELPVERKWTFNSQGITYSNVLKTSFYSWDKIKKVFETKNAFFFHLSESKFLTPMLDFLPLRVLSENQKITLKEILTKNLENSRLKFQTK
ncbi:MAG: YcxB family protein [Candidatus Thorarchaeota archaeon]